MSVDSEHNTYEKGNAYAKSNGHEVIVTIQRWGDLQGTALLDTLEASALKAELEEAISDIESSRKRNDI